jgi:hypothetical protein
VPSTSLDSQTERLLDMWVEAKRSRDFTTADTIRSQLEAKGIKPEAVRPHVWEPPGSRKPGTHGIPPMGRGGGGPPPMGLPSMGRGGPPMSMAPPMGGRKMEVPKLPPGIDTSVGDWHCQVRIAWKREGREAYHPLLCGPFGQVCASSDHTVPTPPHLTRPGLRQLELGAPERLQPVQLSEGWAGKCEGYAGGHEADGRGRWV